MAAEPQLAHMVYFTLKDPSPANIERQIAACHKYLTDHPGTVLFAVGPRITDLTRPVNDQEFHVGLHVIFKNRAAHDTYQAHQRHLDFIAEWKDHWARARVFDAEIA